MKFEKFYFEKFEDVPFREDNPRYVLSQEGVDEIITEIVKHEKYTLSSTDFGNKRLVNQLLHIDVLKENSGKLALAAPVFVEQDLEVLKSLCSEAADRISKPVIDKGTELEAVAGQIHNGFSTKVNLYHLLCGQIFDGYMFDFLEEEKLVTTSKVHNSGLDYLVVMYEKSDRLENYSNLLLCSYNRMATKYGVFLSLGDSDGDRKDFYRYLRLCELGKLKEEQRKYIDFDKEELALEFNRFLDGYQIKENYMEILEYFGYISNGRVNVPVYGQETEEIVIRLYEMVRKWTGDILIETLSKMKEDTRLLAIRHGVDVRDIGNEIYHLIFGEVNEQLVQSGLAANPVLRPGQGRFLQSYERK